MIDHVDELVSVVNVTVDQVGRDPGHLHVSGDETQVRAAAAILRDALPLMYTEGVHVGESWFLCLSYNPHFTNGTPKGVTYF